MRFDFGELFLVWGVIGAVFGFLAVAVGPNGKTGKCFWSGMLCGPLGVVAAAILSIAEEIRNQNAPTPSAPQQQPKAVQPQPAQVKPAYPPPPPPRR